ncbi:MAG: hypothetical protein Q4A40_01515 [Bacillota bacterium]|nr:hypothetical protein [Bacillota bacterium]
MNRKCSICGCTYDTFAFKGGYICDACLQYVRNSLEPDTQVRRGK